jgi:hypothetical protein
MSQARFMDEGRAEGVYRGPERRRRRVFVTHNTEYHCVDGVCVAVRNRETGAFVMPHNALGRHIDGALKFNPEGGIASAHSATSPQPGEQLCFSSGHVDDPKNLLTSTLERIVRPPKEVIARYPAPPMH